MRGLLLALIALSGAAHAADDWVPVATGSKGGVYTVRISDIAQPPSAGGYRTFWVKADFSKDATVTYRTSMTRFSVNCGQETYSLLATITYRADGTTLQSYTPPFPKTDAIVPDSVIAAIARAACPAKE